MTAKKPATKTVAKRQGKIIPGLEGITQEMLVIPRLKLVQKNSVEVDSGVNPGSIVNSVTKDLIVKKGGSLILMPIKYKPSRIMFAPFSEGGGLLCQSQDGLYGIGDPGRECLGCEFNPIPWEKDKKTNKGIPPPCTELINIFCIVRDYDFPIPVIASFGRTSAPAGNQLLNMFYFDSKKAQKSPWNFAYELGTEYKESAKGNYFQFKIAPGGMAKVREIKQGDEFYRLVTSTEVVIHEDEDEMKEEADNIKRANKKKSKKDTSAPEMQEDDGDPFDDDDD